MLRIRLSREAWAAFRLLCLFLALTSHVALALLWLGKFEPWLALCGGLLLLIPARAVLRNADEGLAPPRLSRQVLLVLLLAAVLRVGPGFHEFGGREPGLYVNLGQQLLRTRSWIARNELRLSLTAQEKAIYEKNGGETVPGLVYANPERTEFEFSCYPVHAIWMSIFAKLLGPERGSYCLVAFSLLSVLTFYFLAGEVCGWVKTVPELAALLYALNPVGVYLAKTPFNETTASFFILSGFFFLARASRRTPGRRLFPAHAWLALCCFSAFFLTRMSGILYFPFLFCLWAGNRLLGSPKGRGSDPSRRWFGPYVAAFASIFGLSWIYYRALQPDLFFRVLRYNLELYPWERAAALGGAACALSAVAFVLLRGRARFLADRIWVLPLLALAAQGLGAIRLVGASTVGFIGTFGLRHVSPGLRNLKYSVPFHELLILSPVALIALFALPWWWKKRSPFETAVLIFLSIHLLALCRAQALPSSLAFDRYLSTEILPAGLLVAAIFFGERLHRAGTRVGAAAALALMVAYSAGFSAPQIGRAEGNGRDFLDAVTARVGTDDLLFFAAGSEFYGPMIKTALAYSRSLRIFPLSSPSELHQPAVAALARAQKAAYLLASAPVASDPSLQLVQKLTYRYEQLDNGTAVFPTGQAPEWVSFLLPVRYSESRGDYFLYRILD